MNYVLMLAGLLAAAATALTEYEHTYLTCIAVVLLAMGLFMELSLLRRQKQW